ncbi:MAG TPA: cytochrome c3 family protein, partial [Polyangiaceae bacterium]|nr:cytochrome c3 family protein [Polyangiaceae bacterium]
MSKKSEPENFGGASRSSQRSHKESLWLLTYGCLCALVLALCGQSPIARADSVPALAPSNVATDAGAAPTDADISNNDAGPFGTPPSLSSPAPTQPSSTSSQAMARLAHGLAPELDGSPIPEADRPPGALPNDHGPSAVIFPLQEITIRFNHQRHVKELGLTCTTCHEKTRTSHDSAESMLPQATRCDACHGSNHRDLLAVKADANDPISQCAFCHLGYSAADGNRVRQLSLPKPNLRFDHAIHVTRNIGCQQCHGEVENLELATRDQLPRMRGCFNCHQAPAPAAGKARSDCKNCHIADPSGMIRVSFASGAMSPPTWLHDSGHGPDWIARHKLIAGNDSRFCGNCHSEKYCADCHDGRVRPRNVHPNDWLNMHPVAARENQQKCTSCHREQSFCLTCHQRVGITMSGPFADAAGRGRFHPPKSEWTDGPRTPRHHAWEAERNISACVSCHVERDCAICHAT